MIFSDQNIAIGAPARAGAEARDFGKAG